MTTLITGLDGFTGMYVARALEATEGPIVGLKSDITDYEAMRAELVELSPNVVVHLAAIANVAHGNVKEMYDVNIVGTRNLLQILSELPSKPERVLLASSANVYGSSDEFVSEATLVSPANEYAVTKYSMELVARLWHEVLPITIVRPFNYTGVGQTENFLIPKVVRHFRQKMNEIELGNIDVYREFNDVRFVADTYAQLLKVESAGGTFNICSGKAYSLREVVSLCERLTGHKLEVRVNPLFVRKNEVRMLKGSPDLLNETIGAQPEFTLEQTLQWMLAS